MHKQALFTACHGLPCTPPSSPAIELGQVQSACPNAIQSNNELAIPDRATPFSAQHMQASHSVCTVLLPKDHTVCAQFCSPRITQCVHSSAPQASHSVCTVLLPKNHTVCAQFCSPRITQCVHSSAPQASHSVSTVLLPQAFGCKEKGSTSPQIWTHEDKFRLTG